MRVLRMLMLLAPVGALLSGCGVASLAATAVDTAAGVAGTAVDIVTYPVR